MIKVKHRENLLTWIVWNFIRCNENAKTWVL